MATTAPSDAPAEIAERVGRGQRVAQHRLKERARQRQRAAGEEAEQRARHAQLHEDRPVGLLARAHALEARARTDRRTAAGARPGRTTTAKTATQRLVRLAGRHEYDTQERPDGVVDSVRRDEKSDSQSGVRAASSTGRSSATRAFGEHDDARGVGQREVQVVGHGQAGGAALALLAQQREAVQLLIDVEVRRRLVEQQQLRRLREAGREQHALPLAAAQRLHQAVAKLPAVGPPHRCSTAAAILVGLEPAVGVRIASHQHELAGEKRQVGPHRLRQVRDEPRPLARIPRRRPADR